MCCAACMHWQTRNTRGFEYEKVGCGHPQIGEFRGGCVQISEAIRKKAWREINLDN